MQLKTRNSGFTLQLHRIRIRRLPFFPQTCPRPTARHPRCGSIDLLHIIAKLFPLLNRQTGYSSSHGQYNAAPQILGNTALIASRKPLPIHADDQDILHPLDYSRTIRSSKTYCSPPHRSRLQGPPAFLVDSENHIRSLLDHAILLY